MSGASTSIEARVRSIGHYVNVDKVVDLWNNLAKSSSQFQVQDVVIRSWSGRPKLLRNGLTYFTISCEVSISDVILLILAPIPYNYPNEQPAPYMMVPFWYTVTSSVFDVKREDGRPVYKITYKKSFSVIQDFLTNMRMLLTDLKNNATLRYTPSYYALKESIDNTERIIKDQNQLSLLSNTDIIFKSCNNKTQLTKQIHVPFDPETMLNSTINPKGSSIIKCQAIKNALNVLFKSANTHDGPVFSESDLIELLALYKELVDQYLREYEVSA